MNFVNRTSTPGQIDADKLSEVFEARLGTHYYQHKRVTINCCLIVTAFTNFCRKIGGGEVGRPSPPTAPTPIIFERPNWPQQTIYHCKENFVRDSYSFQTSKKYSIFGIL